MRGQKEALVLLHESKYDSETAWKMVCRIRHFRYQPMAHPLHTAVTNWLQKVVDCKGHPSQSKQMPLQQQTRNQFWWTKGPSVILLMPHWLQNKLGSLLEVSLAKEAFFLQNAWSGIRQWQCMRQHEWYWRWLKQETFSLILPFQVATFCSTTTSVWNNYVYRQFVTADLVNFSHAR